MSDDTEDLRLRPRGHWDRQAQVYYLRKSIEHVTAEERNISICGENSLKRT